MKINSKKIINYLIIIFLCFYCFSSIVFAEGLDESSWGPLKQDLQNIFNFAKIIVPLLIIGLSTIDFISAITSKEAKDVKKAFEKLVKRLIYAVIFFFLPVLINFLMDLVGTNTTMPVE